MTTFMSMKFLATCEWPITCSSTENSSTHTKSNHNDLHIVDLSLFLKKMTNLLNILLIELNVFAILESKKIGGKILFLNYI